MSFIHRLICSLLLLAALPSAPLDAERQPPPPSPRPKRVWAHDSLWTRAWTTGADSHNDRFVEPRQLSITGNLLMVLDMGTREVTGLDVTSGRERFVMKARGRGPGEFQRPALLTSTPTGFAILDHATARLTAFRENGAVQWDAVVPAVFSVDGVCIIDEKQFFLKYPRGDSSFVQFDTSGRRLATQHIPWQQPFNEPPGFAFSASTRAAATRNTCVISPRFGGEWATIDTKRGARTFPLVSAGPPPKMQYSEKVLDRSLKTVTIEGLQQSDTPHATRGLIVRGDTAIVNAGNAKESEGRVLDYYLLETGRYIHSRMLPTSFAALAISEDGTFFGAVIGPHAQGIIALRPANTPAPRPRPAPAPPPKRR